MLRGKHHTTALVQRRETEAMKAKTPLLIAIASLLIGGVYMYRKLLRGKPILFLAGLLAAVGITLFGLEQAAKLYMLGGFANLAFVLTLAVVLIYAYDTHRIADWTCAPSASFTLGQPDPKNAPLIVTSFPSNFSKIPLQCWCNLHISVCHNNISYGGFYSAEKPWYLQPLQRPHGVVRIDKILDKAGVSLDQMQKKWQQTLPEDRPSLLQLDAEFWYKTLDSRFESPRFHEGYYFDFEKLTLVLFPHLEQSSPS